MNYHFICVDCGRTYKKDEVCYVCPACEKEQRPMEPTRGVLKVLLDYEALKETFTRDHLNMCAGRGMVRYTEILPLEDPNLLPPLRVGPTPLYHPERLAKKLGLKRLFLKDDTGLPTGSLKDRASAFVVAKARELGVGTIVTASTGNAAVALAAMCASVGMEAVIFVPASAPPAKLTQMLTYGARVIPIKGTYDQAFDLSLEASKKFGWYNRNTAYNPFTIEGKKTCALEIWEELGVPDKIFIPTGDGVILAGIYKGFWDLLQLGLVEKMPQLIAVQAEGSSAIVKMLDTSDERRATSNEQRETSDPPASPREAARLAWRAGERRATTIADSICVAAPRNAHWAVKAIRETKGFGVTVTDQEIIEAIAELGRTTGIFAEPAAAAAVAGLIREAMRQWGNEAMRQGDNSSGVTGFPGLPAVSRAGSLRQDETIVVLITGNGLKDIPAAQKAIKLPEAIEPRIEKISQ